MTTTTKRRRGIRERVLAGALTHAERELVNREATIRRLSAEAAHDEIEADFMRREVLRLSPCGDAEDFKRKARRKR